MKATKLIATYKRLRGGAVWRLLAADHAPIIIGLLQIHLLENQRRLPASILYERVNRDLEELRSQGEDLPQTVQGYIADWLAAGYLERRFHSGATEEEYELSTATASAIRFAATLIEHRTTATESRLSTVIQQLVRLAEETDTNPKTRITSLEAERIRVDQEIKSIQQGRLQALSDPSALERIHEIINLADELISDFRRVRDDFAQLNRVLRESLMDHEGHRGEVLNALFTGVDVIAQSEAGRTFSAFWRLLTDPEQSSALEHALDQVLSRPFTSKLDLKARRFLLNLTRNLLEQGGMVHEVLQNFARSLKYFVQSREYLEQRRLHYLLQAAQRAALTLKETLKAIDNLEYTLPLTSCRLRSLSQWVLHDPSLHIMNGEITEGNSALTNLATISELVAQSEIDFRTLKANIRALLTDIAQVSIAQVLQHYPAKQGLGSIIGYIALGSRHGVRINQSETISWYTTDLQPRSAQIPSIFFLRERAHELA